MKPLPLHESNRLLLAEAFQDCQRVDLAIDCAIEGHMGAVYVDDLDAPTAFLLRTSLFHYFAGDSSSSAGRRLIAAIKPPALLLPAAAGWLDAAYAVHGQRLQPQTRFSFSADSLAVEHLRPLAQQAATVGQIVPITTDNVTSPGSASRGMLSIEAFASLADFLRRGRGYFCLVQDRVVGSAYASLACPKGIEVSIFVLPRLRQRGVATALAAQLLLDCLADGLEPHWDAANGASIALAKKLGYRPLGPYEAAYLTA